MFDSAVDKIQCALSNVGLHGLLLIAKLTLLIKQSDLVSLN